MIPLLVPIGLGLIGGYLTKDSDYEIFAKGGKIKGDIGKYTGIQYGYTLKEYEVLAKKNGLLVSPREYWKSQDGSKYKDSFGRTQTITDRDKNNLLNHYSYKIMIGIDLGSDKIPTSAKNYAKKNWVFKEKEIAPNYDNKYDNGGEIGEDGVVQYPTLSNIKPQVVNDIGELPIIDIVKLKSVKYIGDSIKSSMDSVDLMRKIYTPEILQTYEMAYAILLDNNNKPYYIYEHSKGSVNGTIMDVEMVCAAALKSLAKGVIVVHNHPSGNLQPSSADIRVTDDMNKGLNSIGIKLLDSIIITKDGYKSFADEGMMPN